ncbi:hypothetical protein EDD17DRAFT_1615590, partial [Pisolithus thermaeus]
LYGVATLQGRFRRNTYVYYLHDSEDALTIKFLVAAVWILDTLHILFVSTSCNHRPQLLQITNYGVPTSLEYIVWSLPVLVIFAVQCFFTHQIYHLYRSRVKWWVTVPIILSVLAEFEVETAILEYPNLSNHVRRNTDLRA